MLSGKVIIICLIAGQTKEVSLYKMSCYPKQIVMAEAK